LRPVLVVLLSLSPQPAWLALVSLPVLPLPWWRPVPLRPVQ